MPRLLTCPQGHQWELPENEGSSATGLQVLCPVCGAAVDLQEPSQTEPASAETGTYHASRADQSEAETLTPKQQSNVEELPEALPAPQELVLAPEVPGYEILALLGRGGMGMVYKARQSKLDRMVALKILPQETSSDSTFAERFTREARALAQLNHSNIVGVYDFGQAGSLSYFVMEFVDGVNLRQRMRTGLIAPRETLQIMSQICDALQYAHDEGIVHRDIKPENILRDKRGRVKIADFGIAKLLARKTTDYTLTGPWQVVGTFNYMAPEQIENPQKLDHRADIYSLGVMFYEMLTGGLPMGRFALPSQKAAIDGRIDEVVLKALEKEPERRYQHVRELKAVIDALLTGSGVRPVLTTASEIHSSPAASTATWPGEFPSAIPVGATRERIRRQLHGPALGLKIAGALGICSGVAWAAFVAGRVHESNFIIAALNLAQGLLVFIGAWQIENLRSYRIGILGCFLAMLPCFSPAVLIGLPIGLWALVVLLRPEVRAAFTREPLAPPAMIPEPPPPRKGFFGRTFGTTTGWAMILCLLGSYLIVAPWAVYSSPSPNGSSDWYGYEVGLGIATESVLAALFLLLLATSFMDPPPIWRAVAMFIGGGVVTLLASLSANGARKVEGAGLAIAVGVGILILAALQIRGILMRRWTAV